GHGGSARRRGGCARHPRGARGHRREVPGDHRDASDRTAHVAGREAPGVGGELQRLAREQGYDGPGAISRVTGADQRWGAMPNSALFEELARELGVLRFHVADRGLIAREFAIATATAMGLDDDVNLNATSHLILTEVFEIAGELRGV